MKSRSMFVTWLVVAVIVVAIAACSSSDPYDNQPPNGRPRSTGEGGGFRGAAAAGGGAGMLEVLPPPNWWRDDRIAAAVNLTPDQVAALDKISADQGDDVARLIRDSQVAVRQLRDSLGLEQPKAEDITSAGQRLRTLRDDIFDRQLQMLTAERQLLSSRQWTALENELQNARTERQQNRGGYPGGRGRGGMGGRRPGWG